MPAIKYEQLERKERGESSAEIRKRVEAARLKQRERYRKINAVTNTQLRSKYFEHYCPLTGEARHLLHRSFQSLNLFMRAHDRIIRVARTIADLNSSEVIDAPHVAEAVQYRSLDRQE